MRSRAVRSSSCMCRHDSIRCSSCRISCSAPMVTACLESSRALTAHRVPRPTDIPAEWGSQAARRGPRPRILGADGWTVKTAPLGRRQCALHRVVQGANDRGRGAGHPHRPSDWLAGFGPAPEGIHAWNLPVTPLCALVFRGRPAAVRPRSRHDPGGSPGPGRGAAGGEGRRWPAPAPPARLALRTRPAPSPCREVAPDPQEPIQFYQPPS